VSDPRPSAAEIVTICVDVVEVVVGAADKGAAIDAARGLLSGLARSPAQAPEPLAPEPTKEEHRRHCRLSGAHRETHERETSHLRLGGAHL
jgi:hypothetical protein